MAAISDLGAGFCWLKSFLMFCARFVRSALIEWCGLKPWCVGERGKWGLTLLRTNLSSIFDELQRREIRR